MRGTKFDKLTPIEYMRNNTHGTAIWKCKCDCGSEYITTRDSLQKGHSRDCGCVKETYLEGKRIGRLTVIKKTDDKNISGRWMWLCKCECGNECKISAHELVCEKTKSCGCLKTEFIQSITKPKSYAAITQILNGYVTQAKQRGLEFSLSRDQFIELITRNCFYCNCAPSQLRQGKYNGNMVYNGIDRVDNEKGYIISNVVACCKKCNWAKKDMTVFEFKEWITTVYVNINSHPK